MRIFTHFTRAKKTKETRNDIEDFLSENPRENLENILEEEVLYGRRYQSFFCNKSGYEEFLPYMISVTENRFHDSAVFIEHKYSHGIVFAPGVIEATNARPITYRHPDDLHKLMEKRDKLSERERIAWLLEEGYLYNVSQLNGKKFSGEKEYRMKLFPEIHHKDPSKGLGLQLPKKDIALLIVPEADREYFETKFQIPAIPQEKIVHLANARKDKTEGTVHEFPEDDFFLFQYANHFLEKNNISYRWKKERNALVRVSA